VIREIGIAVPAHNEQERLPACLAALHTAASTPGVPPVRVVVIDDNSTDKTAAIARAGGAEVLSLVVNNAGAARAAGLDFMIRSASVSLSDLWLATTDADSRVPPHWLAQHVRSGFEGWDAVAGTVIVDDWSGHHHETVRQFAQLYGPPRDGHPHVHGANLGLSAVAYRTIGGFRPLAVAEDHALVGALTASGFRVARPGGLAVTTSARSDPRAANGFGALLRSMDEATAENRAIARPQWRPFRRTPMCVPAD
jgi:glycosyltransferase involved in cell wall biosynthesis